MNKVDDHKTHIYRNRGGGSGSGNQHHILKFLKIKTTIEVGVIESNHGCRIIAVGVIPHAKPFQDRLKLMAGDEAIAIQVKDLEGFDEVALQFLCLTTSSTFSILLLRNGVVKEQELAETKAFRFHQRFQLLYGVLAIACDFKHPIELLKAQQPIAIDIHFLKNTLQIRLR